MKNFVILFVCLGVATKGLTNIGGQQKACDNNSTKLPAGIVSVSLFDVHFCSGAIVSSKWVLSTYSCINNMLQWWKNTQIIAGKQHNNVSSHILNQTCFETSNIKVTYSYRDCLNGQFIEAYVSYAVIDVQSTKESNINSSSTNRNTTNNVHLNDLILLKLHDNYSLGEDYMELKEYSRDITPTPIPSLNPAPTPTPAGSPTPIPTQQGLSLITWQENEYNGISYMIQTTMTIQECDESFYVGFTQNFTQCVCGEFLLPEEEHYVYSMHTGDPLIAQLQHKTFVIGFLTEDFMNTSLRIDQNGIQERKYYYPSGLYNTKQGIAFYVFNQTQLDWVNNVVNTHNTSICDSSQHVSLTTRDIQINKQNRVYLYILIPLSVIIVISTIYTAQKILRTRRYQRNGGSRVRQQNSLEADGLVRHLARQLNQQSQFWEQNNQPDESYQSLDQIVNQDHVEQTSAMLSMGELTQYEMSQEYPPCQNLPPDSAFDCNLFEVLKLPPTIKQIDFHRGLRDMVRIGAGGFASVYQARYQEQIVAVKVLSPQYCSDHQLRAILEEMDNMSKLQYHPNIVSFVGAALAPQPAIVMEYVPHGTLSSLLTEQELQYKQQLQLFIGVAKGLQYLHSVNIVHRDLKPQNVLIMDKEKMWVKIADFGLSRLSMDAALLTTSFGGTANYMAPESFSKRNITQKVDVWAFGCIMQQVVRGVPPWRDCSKEYVMHQVANRHSPPDHGVLPQLCPKELQSIIKKCWNVDPSKRPTAQNLVDQLERISNGFSARQSPHVSQLFQGFNNLFSMFNTSKQGQGDDEQIQMRLISNNSTQLT